MPKGIAEAKICQFCGKSFAPDWCNQAKQIFCSRTCKRSVQSAPRKCVGCGAEFTSRKDNTKQIWCSRPCAAKHQTNRKGGSPFWKLEGLEARKQLARERFSGANNPKWKGGRYLANVGHVMIKTENGYRLEHRHVVEKCIGRRLLKTEVVHHVDMNGQNNELSNLIVLTRPVHVAVHTEYARRFAAATPLPELEALAESMRIRYGK